MRAFARLVCCSRRLVSTGMFAAALFMPLLAVAGTDVETAQADACAVEQRAEQAITSYLIALAKQSRSQLKATAEQTVSHWLAPESMAKRLAGNDNWQSLHIPQQQILSQEMSRTLSRYLLEVAQVYSGQQVSVEATKQASPHRCQVTLAVQGVPGKDKVTVIIELVRQTDEWKVADFSVEGISYTTTKRWQYQVLWQTGGFERYWQHLKEKNDRFFQEWEKSVASVQQSVQQSVN